jgi:hypothetical protein
MKQFQNVTGVIVWGAISKKGKLLLLFIAAGVKYNQDYYIKHVLENHPYMPKICIEKILRHSTKPNDWFELSLDLNPLDYLA